MIALDTFQKDRKRTRIFGVKYTNEADWNTRSNLLTTVPSPRAELEWKLYAVLLGTTSRLLPLSVCDYLAVVIMPSFPCV